MTNANRRALIPGRSSVQSIVYWLSVIGYSRKARDATLGGEIASRLAYIQKSRGQYLPGRPLSIVATEVTRWTCLALPAFRLVTSATGFPADQCESRTPVFDTGRAGAVP